MLPTFVAPFGL